MNAADEGCRGGGPRSNPYNGRVLVAALFLVAIRNSPVRSAAVVDNIDKQQALVSSEDLSGVTNGGCDDGRVVNCQTLPLFNYTDLALPLPENGDIIQDENCPSKSFERHLRCVDVFTRRCLTSDQRAAFYKLYTVPTLDMQELCTVNGPYREEYLKHADCLRTVHSEYVQCGRKHQHELSALMQDHSRQQLQSGGDATTAAPLAASPDQITKNLVHLCGSFRGHLRCVNGLVRETCGPQTEAFASQFLSQMASSLLNVCENYGAGNANEIDGGVSQSSSSSGSAAVQAAAGGSGAIAAAAVLVATAYRLR